MGLDTMYSDEHWRQLMETIIERIGVKQYLLISMSILYELGYKDLVTEIVMEHVAILDKAAKTLEGTK